MPHAFWEEIAMGVLGGLLVCLGLLVGWVGFSMDTSVPSGDGKRIHNLGLMRDQENTVIVGGVLFLGGLILVAAGGRSGARAESKGAPQIGEKACPYCAETIKTAAIKCRFCGEDLLAPRPGGEPQYRREPTIPTLTEVIPPAEAGRCPNCDATIRLDSAECRHCKAIFGGSGAWKVKPLGGA